MRRAFRTTSWVALTLVLGAVLIACGDDDGSLVAPTATGARAEAPLSGRISVFAAASLTDAFSEIGRAFEAQNPGVSVDFNFAGSAALRAQIEQGAPADVFASANTAHMDALTAAGLAIEPAIFTHNSLVIIAPQDNPGGITTLADLKKPGLKLVLAAAEVPVGGYARQMLQNATADPQFGSGFADAVLANLVSNEANVKQVVAKVQLGEADVGIVYGTDVTPDVAPALRTIDVPHAVNVIADYPIAVLEDAHNLAVARAFVAFVLSADGQAILAKWGFTDV